MTAIDSLPSPRPVPPDAVFFRRKKSAGPRSGHQATRRRGVLVDSSPLRPSGRIPAALIRRVAAALLLTAGLASMALLFLSRPAPDAVPVLVAAGPVAVGSVINADQVEVRQLPPQAIPHGALREVGQAVGRPASSALVAGEVLTSSDVHTPSLLAGQPAKTVAVYLPLGEAAVITSVRPGDRVGIHSPVDGALVVSAARVLQVQSDDHQSGRGGLWLAVDLAQAESLAAARGMDPAGFGLTVSVHAP